ncbi:MAG TPA: MFS transporter [Mycobacteriales bacterium]|nr:MFS transporter [Mycobacteriales bacterium]
MDRLKSFPLSLAVFFALLGFLLANWIVRIPDFKAQVSASPGLLGFALLGNSLGALLAMTGAGRLCVRFGTHRVIVIGAAATSLAVILPSLAHSVLALGASFVLVGAVHGSTEVGLNSAAVEVEATIGRSIMSPLHGLFSLGALIGSLTGAGFSAAFGPFGHLVIVSVLSLACTAATGPFLLRDHVRWNQHGLTVAGPAPARIPHRPLVVLLGIVALCTAYGEGSIGDWGAVHLHDGLGAGVTVAAYGYAAYSVAITAARLWGSWLRARLGETGLLVGGSLLACGGILLAAWTGSIGVAMLGYVAVGFGLANGFPITIARAGAIGGARAVAAASTLGLSGMLMGPPVIGFVADRSSLPAGLSSVAVLCGIAAVLAVSLRSRAAVRPEVDATAAR